MFDFTRRQAAFALAAGLAACGRSPQSGADAPPTGSLGWAIAGSWRIDPERDRWRHPLQTLLFWGLQGNMTVLEVYPGLGWYTSILAPYLAANDGRLIAASFDPDNGTAAQREVLAAWQARFLETPDLYGRPQQTVVGRQPIAPAGSVDLAIIANNLHTLMAEGLAERVLRDVLAALRPGGTLGIEQHRAPSSNLPQPPATSGYVLEEFAKTLATEAGFEFIAASDMNANPRDTRDHPFGVWTLPPTLRTAPLGQPDNPDFDTAPYVAIGESDRMTLRFRKPTGAAAGAPAPAESRP